MVIKFNHTPDYARLLVRRLWDRDQCTKINSGQLLLHTPQWGEFNCTGPDPTVVLQLSEHSLGV